ncbi:MAG: lamin tail domain-containing protein [Candidatus Omnitrophica bacterium]|nr:lamin tail domain-containing protein [Candidatus Omnitrophota bacterium]
MKKFSEKGQALLVVVTILGMMFVAGISFFALSQAERASSLRHLDALRARYVAEAGVVYAQGVLKLDRKTNLLDSLDDDMFTKFSGNDIDLDNDGIPESRWFNLTDAGGNSFGRFSVKVADEAGKLNINTCPQEAADYLFSQLGISEARALLSSRPLNAIEQAGSALGKEDFARVKNFITVYSRDREIDIERKRRTYLNSSSAQLLLEACLNSGINSPQQKAANLKDAQDADCAQTVFATFSRQNISPSGLSEYGSWRRIGSYYEAEASGQAGTFVWSNLSVEDGEYQCFLYGYESGDVVGEVEGQYIFSGDALVNKVNLQNGSLSIEIKPAQDQTSRFSHIELSSPLSKQGLSRKTITGTEAIVINELMVKPWEEKLIGGAEIAPGDSATFTFSEIKAGNYYVVVLANSQGGLVGDVSIGSRQASNLHDKDYFPYSVNVGTSKTLALEIKNNSLSSSSFKGIRIFQQPDAEFIEILNLSPQAIDLSDFSLEVYLSPGELAPGWPAHIPEGISISPYQHLVLAIDSNDSGITPTPLKNNSISFQAAWQTTSVGIQFETDIINKTFDLLPDAGAIVVLRDAAGGEVDAVEYSQTQVNNFTSLERGDPSSKSDADGDGIFDGWYTPNSEEQASPGLTNENIGMYTRDKATGKLVSHNPSEIAVFNRPISNLEEVMQLSSGESWQKFSISDLARLSDRFAYAAIKFNFREHFTSGDFSKTGDVCQSTHQGDTGLWEFSSIPAGTYLLSIFSGDINASSQEIQVAYRTDAAQEFKDFSTLIFNQGVAFYGWVDLSADTTLTLQLKIMNNSTGVVTLKEICLEPVNYTSGRINVNTATKEVLSSIFNSNLLADTVIKNRPIGLEASNKLGVGELLLLDSNFINFQNYLTVKSDVYEINSRGEYSPLNKTIAFQLIRSVTERGE